MEGPGQSPDADDDWGNAPYFNRNDGKLNFDYNWASNVNDNYSAGSAWEFPKSI